MKATLTLWTLILTTVSMMAADGVNVRIIGLAELQQRFAGGKDTTFVVNFWATWCKPCIAELPVFDRLHRERSGKPLAVLLVSLDDPEEVATVVEPFLKRKGIRPECVLLDEPDPNSWIEQIDEAWSGAIPATMLVAGASGRRQFFEQDFTFEELNQAVTQFEKASK